MKIFLLIILIVILTIIMLFMIGMILPKQRVITSEKYYTSPPEKVFKIVVDNENFRYRRDLKNLKMIEKNEFEVWDEYLNNGSVVRFKTVSKIPFSKYEMEMKGKFFTGYWKGIFNETETGGTLFITTEQITIKNPFFRTINFLFFNLARFMKNYQEDVEKALDT